MISILCVFSYCPGNYKFISAPNPPDPTFGIGWLRLNAPRESNPIDPNRPPFARLSKCGRTPWPTIPISPSPFLTTLCSARPTGNGFWFENCSFEHWQTPPNVVNAPIVPAEPALPWPEWMHWAQPWPAEVPLTRRT